MKVTSQALSLADLFDSDGLAGQGLAEAEAAAAGDRDGFIVAGILELTDAGVGAR